MKDKSREVCAWLLCLLALGIASCADNTPANLLPHTLSGTTSGKTSGKTSGATQTPPPCSGNLCGGILAGTPGPTATPGATASATPTASPSASPTPAALATPKIAVTSVVANPAALTLYPPAASSSLGLPSTASVAAYAVLANGTQGQVTWWNPATASFTVSSSGLISVQASASPGTYDLRAVSVDDPGLYQDVIVTVLTTSEMDVTVQ